MVLLPFLAAVWAVIACTGLVSADGGKAKNQYEVVVKDTLASAMMLGLANENTAFIFDKVEGNFQKTTSGRPTWASLVDLNTFEVRGIDAQTNPFCAAGMTLGNGSYIVVGGNSAISYGGQNINLPNGTVSTGPVAPYKDFDGRRVVRIMEPNEDASQLSWVDDYNSPNQMDSPRWYPGIEGLADGSVVIIGGATNGGFINRNTPNVDPVYATQSSNPSPGVWDQGGANPSYEFWPPTGKPKPALSQFMVKTSGLNMYAHTYLMPSGKIFMQANYSTTLWDWGNGKYHDLPDMPGQITRVYPASGATAMKPLTPENNYTPTILFCGGFHMTDEEWGNYTAPNINVYDREGSKDCSSITPETATGKMVKNVKYVKEEDLPEPRSMGQFIHLPNGKMVIVNGASRGLAGYGNTSWNEVKDKNGNKVYLEGMSQSPTLRPVVYDPDKPQGQRLEYDGFGHSDYPRLYHSSAILAPDGSVLVAGSNPHMDVAILPPNDQLDTKYEAFNTTYVMEKWYPDYYFEERPVPHNLPKVIGYGGDTFNITVPAKYMNPDNNANEMANRTRIFVIRTGFSTHAYNFGQRSLELENTFTVQDDGSVEFMVNPMPTNMNLFVPGPAMLFVTVNGVPSHGKFVMLGKQNPGPVPFNLKPGPKPKPLPKPQLNSKYSKQAPQMGMSTEPDDDSGLSGGAIAGIVIGVLVALAIIAAIVFFVWRQNRQKQTMAQYASIGRPQAPASSGSFHQASNAANPVYGSSSAGWSQSDMSQQPMMMRNDSQMSFVDEAPAPAFSTVNQSRTWDNQAPNDFAKTSEPSLPAVPHQNSNPFLQEAYSDHDPSNQASLQQSNRVPPPPTSTMTTAPVAQRQPYMVPQPTTHWNDIPARPQMMGPREMPQSNLQQHITASQAGQPPY
ncbi:(methyl)glyoxal oxidase [Malassezia caprae]|uniref:(Methyl)glyoxal oxidase n=1 Tax=Malassezia caprae TaxID=1381934 RepID=A0AAF0J0F4_9BASI|nr:(methyl)glyoxal oxidase [Malassezia caprae]